MMQRFEHGNLVTEADYFESWPNEATMYRVTSSWRHKPPKILLEFFINADGSFVGSGADMETYYRHFPWRRSL
jgi:hypothetical protein